MVNMKEKIIRLYQTESKKIYNFIYKMTGDKYLSEDLLQETFISAYQKIDTFREESSLLTWIYSIAKNHCLQQLRKIRKNRISALEKLLETASADKRNNFYSDIEKNIYIIQVKEGCLLGLLRCLPFNQRLVFILNILYEIPVEETSKIIKKSVNATRILIHRSRTRIKNFLCSNCSLYDKKNSCRCENLISFSLKSGWISKNNSNLDLSEIEKELHDFKNEISLYRSLYDHKIDKDVSDQVLNYIYKSESKIFSKKMK